MAATDALIADALARDPARPLITYYDDVQGGRVELSAATLANWIAKTANLFQSELSLEPGDRLALLLPAHWQTATVLLGAWAAGLVVTDDAAGADVVVCAPGAVPDTGGEILTASLNALGTPAPTANGALDYTSATLAQPDAFVPLVPVPADAEVRPGQSGEQVMAAVRARAAHWGLGPSDRILSTLDWTTDGDVAAARDDGLLAPLAAGASLVLSPRPDPERLGERARAEQVTAVVGMQVDRIRLLER